MEPSLVKLEIIRPDGATIFVNHFQLAGNWSPLELRIDGHGLLQDVIAGVDLDNAESVRGGGGVSFLMPGECVAPPYTVRLSLQG
jgi:hypothetical protein